MMLPVLGTSTSASMTSRTPSLCPHLRLALSQLSHASFILRTRRTRAGLQLLTQEDRGVWAQVSGPLEGRFWKLGGRSETLAREVHMLDWRREYLIGFVGWKSEIVQRAVWEVGDRPGNSKVG